MKTLLLLTVLASSAAAAPAEKHEHAKAAPSPASRQFEMIASLAGDWQGAGEKGGKPQPVKTSFRVTSGGTAVVETMDAGTPHEMTNVYHLVGGKLTMTHYCAMGNAPQMKVVKAGAKSLTFEAVAGNGIDPKTTPHMHGLSYEMADTDHLSATWTTANMGPEHSGPVVLAYTRVH